MTKYRVMSHSQKELYKSCRRKWYYQYVEGRDDDSSKSVALVFGIFVHEILEQYMRKQCDLFGVYTINKLALETIVDDTLLNDVEDILPYGSKKLMYSLALQGLLALKKDCKGLFILTSDGSTLGTFALELKLTEGTTYTGIIDLIYTDKKGRTVLLDWKTTSWGGAYTNHKIKQSKQLQGYAWLVEKKLGLSVDMLAYCVLNKKEQTAHIMKVKNTKDYKVFEDELKQINFDSQVYRGEPSSSFPKNEESCFAYRSECPFYDLCWGQDKRDVETIDLVPSLS